MKQKKQEIEFVKISKAELKKMEEEAENNPYHQLFKKNGTPRCTTCGEKFIKIKPYLWKPNCPHIPKHLILAVG